MNRRRFLKQSVYACAVITLPQAVLQSFNAQAEVDPLVAPSATSGLTSKQWRLMSAIQQHLLPSEPTAPGAMEIHAAKFLHFVLTRPELDRQEFNFIITGLKRLAQDVQSSHSGDFVTLSVELKELALRNFEAEHLGYDWLKLMLDYLLEALLSAPAYGANPNGIGWQWLDIQPGFPLPSADKRYFLL